MFPEDWYLCLRQYLHEWLRLALMNSTRDPDINAPEVIPVYESIQKLHSVAWLIHQRTIGRVMLPLEASQQPVTKETPIESFLNEQPIPVGIPTQVTSIEETGLKGIVDLIIERISSVRLVYLIGTHPDPLTYYLLILIDKDEKIPEHDIANKIESFCKPLSFVYLFVHKLSSALKGVDQGAFLE